MPINGISHAIRFRMLAFSLRRKSALVNQIKKPLADLNGCFIEGKFHRDGTRPDLVLVSALNSFFGAVLESAEEAFMSMKWRIHDAIGSGNDNMLLDILPNLRKWLWTAADGGPRLPQSLLLPRVDELPDGRDQQRDQAQAHLRTMACIQCGSLVAKGTSSKQNSSQTCA